ncbi:ABC transporter substrate-binding protein [Brevibacillus fluminis]|uniref:ABC transporter substrate-binding protein n=1 Tax=Brevibacillus fluminis TaxID=511487 RepID=UPI003F8BCA10
MTITLDYLTLRHTFAPFADGEPIRVTLSQLAATLFCTPRNAKLLLKKMEQADWLRFVPGVGRGNASTLTFLLPLQTVLLEVAQARLEHGHLHEAIELLDKYGAGTSAKQQFWQKLSGTFGYAVRTGDTSRIETLRFPTGRQILTLDPAEAFYAFDIHLVRQIFDTLVALDREKNVCIPRLAHSWEANHDATRWVFYLRKGVRFHNGLECTADDVVHTVERLAHTPCSHPGEWLGRQLGTAVALDRYSVLFDLASSNWILPRFLAHPSASIISQVTEPDTGLLAGTGAFRVTKWQPFLTVLEAFDDYFAGRAQTDRVEILQLLPEQLAEWESAAPRQLMVDTGEMAQPTFAGWDTEHFYHASSSILTFNRKKAGPQNDRHFREALRLILAPERMIADLGGFRDRPALGFRYRSGEAMPTESAKASADNIRQLIAQSGYRGEELRLSTYGRHADDARWIAQQCQAFGITMTVELHSWGEIRNAAIWAASDFLLFGAVIYVEQVTQIELLQSAACFIRPHLAPAVDAILDQQIGQLLAEPCDTRREQLLLETERLLQQENALLFLLHNTLTASYPSTVKNVRFTAEGWIDFSCIWFQPDTAKAALGQADEPSGKSIDM